jgi:hypothetical protein
VVSYRLMLAVELHRMHIAAPWEAAAGPLEKP